MNLFNSCYFTANDMIVTKNGASSEHSNAAQHAPPPDSIKYEGSTTDDPRHGVSSAQRSASRTPASATSGRKQSSVEKALVPVIASVVAAGGAHKGAEKKGWETPPQVF